MKCSLNWLSFLCALFFSLLSFSLNNKDVCANIFYVAGGGGGDDDGSGVGGGV